jgi:hypothetical protein
VLNSASLRDRDPDNGLSCGLKKGNPTPEGAYG